MLDHPSCVKMKTKNGEANQPALCTAQCIAFTPTPPADVVG